MPELKWTRYYIPGVYHLTDNTLHDFVSRGWYGNRLAGVFTTRAYPQTKIVDRRKVYNPPQYFDKKDHIPQHHAVRKTLCGLTRASSREWSMGSEPEDRREMCNSCLRAQPKWERTHK